jgi:hypothetical protein
MQLLKLLSNLSPFITADAFLAFLHRSSPVQSNFSNTFNDSIIIVSLLSILSVWLQTSRMLLFIQSEFVGHCDKTAFVFNVKQYSNGS